MKSCIFLVASISTPAKVLPPLSLSACFCGRDHHYTREERKKSIISMSFLGTKGQKETENQTYFSVEKYIFSELCKYKAWNIRQITLGRLCLFLVSKESYPFIKRTRNEPYLVPSFLLSLSHFMSIFHNNLS